MTRTRWPPGRADWWPRSPSIGPSANVRRRRQVCAVAGIPEDAEVRASLVGRILAPEKFSSHLVVEPGHEGFDEALVVLEEGDRVDRKVRVIRDDEGRRAGSQILEHRVGEDRIGHHRSKPPGMRGSGTTNPPRAALTRSTIEVFGSRTLSAFCGKRAQRESGGGGGRFVRA